jgi:hypothetical protein
MFPHPEDLHRLHQQQHAELIRHHTLLRQARGANPPTHRLREIGLQISTFVLSGRWWKGITALFTHHNHPDRTFTTAGRKGALPAITPSTFPLGSPASALTDSAAESTRR